jgi:hypothetical protein
MNAGKLRTLPWLNGHAGVAYGIGFAGVQIWTNAFLHFKTSVPALFIIAAPHAAFALSVAYGALMIAVLQSRPSDQDPVRVAAQRRSEGVLDPARVILCGLWTSSSNLLALAAWVAFTPTTE